MKTATALLIATLLSLPLAHAQSVQATPPAAMANFRAMKYGFFVHYVWGGDAYSATVNKDGSKPAGLDDLANRFDADGFARDMAAMGVEYVLFTAWHADMNVLYPSKVMDKWRPGHSAKRDLIGDMIKACKAKGVQVLLYTHPRDGHDFTEADMAETGWHRGQGSNPDFDKWDRAKWNDFINESYAELVDRYGDDILGLYLDEGSGAADSYRVVDYPRLRKTITAKHPHLLMMQNDYGNLYSCDLGNMEVFYNHSHNTPDGDQWTSYKIPISVVVGSIFWAAFPEGKTEPAQKSAKVGFNKWIPYTPESMFRYTVLQAGSNTDGGGTLWAAGPYAGGGWESGVLGRMRKTGELIKPVERSIKNTYPSASWRTVPGTRIADLTWGVATRSTDDRFEYLHILKPPAGGSKILKLPPPADGKKFSKAVLLAEKKAVSLKQDESGVSLSLPTGSYWDRLNTVIALAVAEDSPIQNVALWKACRASSLADNATHPSKATDGSDGTAWSSHPDDAQPWLSIDLALPCAISRIEINGSFTAGDMVKISDTMELTNAKPLATFTPVPAGTLEIRKATYGNGAQVAEITEKVRQAVVSGGLNLQAENALTGGDPAPGVPKELRVEFSINGKDEVKVIPEGQSITIGAAKPWIIDLPAGSSARYIRLERTQTGAPLKVNEIRVFGRFQ
jgi:alpha-L-fucosidase